MRQSRSSFRASGVAFVLLDTEELDEGALRWFRKEVSRAQDASWLVVLGKDPPDVIVSATNATLAKLLRDSNVALYLSAGKTYERHGHKYSKNYELGKQTDTCFVAQGPLHSSEAETHAEVDFFSYSGAGYALLHAFHSSYLHLEQFSTDTHRLVDEIFTYRQVIQQQAVESEDILAVSLVGLLLLSGLAVIVTTRCMQRYEDVRRRKSLPKTLNVDEVEDLDASNLG